VTKARALSERLSRHLFALSEAGDRGELPEWLDSLDALLRRSGARALEGCYCDGALPRLVPAEDGAPDLDRSATALLTPRDRRGRPCDDRGRPLPRDHRGRPSNRETGRDLGTMRAAYLADVARLPPFVLADNGRPGLGTGRRRRVPPAPPQPAAPFEARFCEVATRREFTARDYPEPLRCHACAALGVDAPLIPRRYERERGGGWRLVVSSCPAGHESLDVARRQAQALGELPADAQRYWELILDGKPEKARREYGVEPVGSVAEVVADFTGALPQPRTVERWIAEGRAAFHALGYWPWALPPGGRVARRWWREPRYADALDCWARELLRRTGGRGEHGGSFAAGIV